MGPLWKERVPLILLIREFSVFREFFGITWCRRDCAESRSFSLKLLLAWQNILCHLLGSTICHQHIHSVLSPPLLPSHPNIFYQDKNENSNFIAKFIEHVNRLHMLPIAFFTITVDEKHKNNNLGKVGDGKFSIPINYVWWHEVIASIYTEYNWKSDRNTGNTWLQLCRVFLVMKKIDFYKPKVLWIPLLDSCGLTQGSSDDEW